MATVYSTQWTAAYITKPSSKLATGDDCGRVRMLKFDHTFAADVNAISDIVKLVKLRKNSKVIGGRLYCPSLGTTGIFHWGYAASAELDSSGSAVEAADADAFGVSLDAGGQAVDSTMAGTVAGFLKEFGAEVDVQLAFTEATDAAEGDSLKGYLLVVQD